MENRNNFFVFKNKSDLVQMSKKYKKVGPDSIPPGPLMMEYTKFFFIRTKFIRTPGLILTFLKSNCKAFNMLITALFLTGQ